jgi:hypothetical protein
MKVLQWELRCGNVPAHKGDIKTSRLRSFMLYLRFIRTLKTHLYLFQILKKLANVVYFIFIQLKSTLKIYFLFFTIDFDGCESLCSIYPKLGIRLIKNGFTNIFSLFHCCLRSLFFFFRIILSNS